VYARRGLRACHLGSASPSR